MKKVVTKTTEWTAADNFKKAAIQEQTTYHTKSATVRVITKPEKQ